MRVVFDVTTLRGEALLRAVEVFKSYAERNRGEKNFLLVSRVSDDVVIGIRRMLAGVVDEEEILPLDVLPYDVLVAMRCAVAASLDADTVVFWGDIPGREILAEFGITSSAVIYVADGAELSSARNLSGSHISAVIVNSSAEFLYLSKALLPYTSVIKLDDMSRLADEIVKRVRVKVRDGRFPKGCYKLAYVSPLPPERCGISWYSKDLLPYLSEYYDIDVVTSMEKTAVDPSILSAYNVVDSGFFESKGFMDYDRIVYHVGNSPFHAHILPMIEKIPGVVVLHDVYISHLIAYLSQTGIDAPALGRELYRSHGYRSLFDLSLHGEEYVKWKYPCSLEVIRKSCGVIVHSEFARRLVQKWYGQQCASSVVVIPHLKVMKPLKISKAEARQKLGVPSNAFLVCSFGYISPSKLGDRIIRGWKASGLDEDGDSLLFFVGEDVSEGVVAEERQKLKDPAKVRITGWVDEATFRLYLAACDVAVQLRANSRGETSGAVLDCMASGVPVIVNNHGSMSEIPDNVVLKLSEDPDIDEIGRLLIKLKNNVGLRQELKRASEEYISTVHNPEKCARAYSDAIERFYRYGGNANLVKLVRRVAEWNYFPNATDYLSVSIAGSLPDPMRKRQVLVDITGTVICDLRTGIERVARSYLAGMLDIAPDHIRVEPVYIDESLGVYRYARSFMRNRYLHAYGDVLYYDDIVDVYPGDVIVVLDISGEKFIKAEHCGLLRSIRSIGAKVYVMVHDILPLEYPEFFPPGAGNSFATWLRCALHQDGIICPSASVAERLKKWIKLGCFSSEIKSVENIRFCHHGSDTKIGTDPSFKSSDDTKSVAKRLQGKEFILCVGTVEPRKAYREVIRAFDMLWRRGRSINLVVVGQEGWRDLPDWMRRDIPETVKMIREHEEYNKKMFWLTDVDDELLEKFYRRARALLAASYDEGFGLPVVEAARYGVPVIARDIEVFREILGSGGIYFRKNATVMEIAEVVSAFLDAPLAGCRSDTTGARTWREASRELLDIVTAFWRL
ncbi:MAG: glycosyltransferase [Thermoproteota archaeon]